jgi:NADPH:quinone reductase-like Zn-dependent oxidoreductase
MDHALWFRRFGPPIEALTLESAPAPPRPSGRARVGMIAAAINPSDLIPITGAYRHRVSPPRVAGYEGCGVVVEADDPNLIGRRVLPLRGDGTWRTFMDADPDLLVPVPDDVPDHLAARAYINPLAALLMLKAHPVAGRRVLLTAAGSSCARMLGAWTLADGANEVVAVHRAPVHRPALAAMGMTPIGQDDAALARVASRCDLVLDAVGGPLADAILAALPRTADFVSYGLLSGLSYRPVAGGPGLHRFHLRDRLEGVPRDVWRGWFESLWPRLRRADFLPDVRPFPLHDWRAALAAFDEPGRTFKPMLTF